MNDQLTTAQFGALIRQARLAQNMTQQHLADKIGIARYRISQAENNIGNVPISILLLIVKNGLGGQFEISFEF